MVILYYPIMQGHSRSTYIVLYNLWYESAICACGFEFTRQANFSFLFFLTYSCNLYVFSNKAVGPEKKSKANKCRAYVYS